MLKPLLLRNSTRSQVALDMNSTRNKYRAKKSTFLGSKIQSKINLSNKSVKQRFLSRIVSRKISYFICSHWQITIDIIINSLVITLFFLAIICIRLSLNTT